MELIRLAVRHFAGVRLAKVEFGPGLNVLYGPNDLGKSTLVTAIRAVLLLPIGSRGRDPYLTWNGSDPPQVELVFRTDARRYWKVKKTFASGSKGRATLESSLDGESFTFESSDSKGVDRKLREILRWGIPGPGGRGAPRGVPETFLTSALLADQGAVADLFARRLGAFRDTSDREVLTNALQVLAQPEEFTRALEIAEARTGEAFSKTGRERRGGQSPLAILREQVVHAEREVHLALEQFQRGESVRTQIQALVQRRVGFRAQVAKASDQAKNLREKKEKADAYRELAGKCQLARENLDRIEQAKKALLDAKKQQADRTEGVSASALRLKNAETGVEAAEQEREQARGAVEQAKLLPDPQAEAEKRSHGLLEKERVAQAQVSRASEVESLSEKVRGAQSEIQLIEETLPSEQETIDRLVAGQQSTTLDLERWRDLNSWALLRDETEVPKRSKDLAQALARAQAEPMSGHATVLENVASSLTDLAQFVSARDQAQQSLGRSQEDIPPMERAVRKAVDDLEKAMPSGSLETVDADPGTGLAGPQTEEGEPALRPLAVLREQVREAEHEVQASQGLREREDAVQVQIQELVQRKEDLRALLAAAESHASGLQQRKTKADTYRKLAESLQAARKKADRIGQAKKALLSAQEQRTARAEGVEAANKQLRDAETDVEAAEQEKDQARDAAEKTRLLPDPQAEAEKRSRASLERERTARAQIGRASDVDSLEEKVIGVQADVQQIEEALPGEEEAIDRLVAAQQSAKLSLERWRDLSSWAHLQDEAAVPERSKDLARILAQAQAEPSSQHATFLENVASSLSDLGQLVHVRDQAQQALGRDREAIAPAERAVQKAVDDVERVGGSDSLKPRLEKRLLELEARETALVQHVERRKRATGVIERAQQLQLSVVAFEAEELGPLRVKELGQREQLEELRRERQTLRELQAYQDWVEAASRVEATQAQIERRGALREQASALRAEIASTEGASEHLPNLGQLPALRSQRETMRMAEARAQSSATPASAIGPVQGGLLLVGVVLGLGGGGLAFSAGALEIYPLVGLGLGLLLTVVAVVQILQTRRQASRRTDEALKEGRRQVDQWQSDVQPILAAAGVDTLEQLEKRIIESQEQSARAKKAEHQAAGLEERIDGLVDLDSQLATAQERSSDLEREVPDDRRQALEALAKVGPPRRQAAVASSLRLVEEELGETSLLLAKTQGQFEALTTKASEAELAAAQERSVASPCPDPEEETQEELSAERLEVQQQLGNLAATVEASKAQSQELVQEKRKGLAQAKDSFEQVQGEAARAETDLSSCWEGLRGLLKDQISRETTGLEEVRKRSRQASVAVAQRKGELDRLQQNLKTRRESLTEAMSSLGAPTPADLRSKAEADLEQVGLQRELEAKRLREAKTKRAETQLAQEAGLEKATRRLTDRRRIREELVKAHDELVSGLATVQGELGTRSEEFDSEEQSQVVSEVADLETRLKPLTPRPEPVPEEQLKEAGQRLELAEAALRAVEDQLQRKDGALGQVGGDAAKERWRKQREALQQLQERLRELESQYQKALALAKEALEGAKSALIQDQARTTEAERELTSCWQRLRDLLKDQISCETTALEEARDRSQQARVALAQRRGELERLTKDLGTKRQAVTEAMNNLGADTPEALRAGAEADLRQIGLQHEQESKRLQEDKARRAEAQLAREAELQKATQRLTDRRRLREEFDNAHKELVSGLDTVQGELGPRSEEFDPEELSRATSEVAGLQAKLEKTPALQPVTEEQLGEAGRRLEQTETALRDVEDQLQHEKGGLAQVGGDAAKERWEERREVKLQLEERERDMELNYGGWQLLLESLREAESQEADFLGKALVPLVEGRFSQLTNGRYGGLSLGPDLDTDGIVVGGNKRAVNALSVGTREQLATLFRLALAERLESTLLLDDQLVQSDSERMRWFKKQLRDSCQKHQVIVVTCRPEDYLEASESPDSGRDSYQSEDGRVRSVNLVRRIERATG